MEVIDLSKDVEEIPVYPDLLKLARNYNLCAVVKNKGSLEPEGFIDEITNAVFLDGTHFHYCGVANQHFYFALKTRYRGKYCKSMACALLDNFGPLISYELISLKMLKKK